jgi:AraC-like DNA-binding protein
VREGECIWILPYDIHRVTTPENSRVTVSIFSTDYVEDFYALVKDKALCQPVIGFPPDALTIVKGGHENKLMLKSVLYGLCAKAAAHGITAEKRGLKSDQSLEILLYIQEHYKEPITLATLAKRLGYSYAYTSTIFKAAFRQSFSATVNAYRLDEAVRLLKQRTHAVTEIVHLCGFSTIRNFNIVFKQHYGVPPSKWLQE